MSIQVYEKKKTVNTIYQYNLIIVKKISKNLYAPWKSYNVFDENKLITIPLGFKKKRTTSKLKAWLQKFYAGTQTETRYKSLNKHKNHDHYFIHDNGGIPYVVYISKTMVYVYRIQKNTYLPPNKDDFNHPDYKNYHNEIVFKQKYKNVYIGKSPLNEMTKISGGYGPSFDGNSILVHVKKNCYVFIGSQIYQFNIENYDNFIKFESPVGNNDVPYPYIVGENNLYSLIGKKVIEKTESMDNFDPNDIFYSNNSIVSKQLKNFKLFFDYI